MPIPSGFTVVTAPCQGGFAVEYVTDLFGPPAPGNRYVCSGLPRFGPLVLGALVKEVPLAAGTYLIQTVHPRDANQDSAVTTTHWRWSDEGSDPDAADHALVEARLDAFWTALVTYRTTFVNEGFHRWYGPFDAPGPHGEAIRVAAAATLDGTATQGLPQQVACSVTLETDVRRRWGRFYIPCLGTNALASPSDQGRWSDAFTTAVANAADTCFTQTLTDWRVVVFGAPTPTSLEVRQIRVDDIPDIIRRRRFEGGIVKTRDLYT